MLDEVTAVDQHHVPNEGSHQASDFDACLIPRGHSPLLVPPAASAQRSADDRTDPWLGLTLAMLPVDGPSLCGYRGGG